ncbi:MAG TPA: septum site-determining protein MinC [Kofleriaceae bacterium]|jgi:septum site-determining protein MinC
MSQAPSIAFAETIEDSHVEAPASVSLKGTTRGLEILISGTPSPAALGARLSELLAEAPGFFAGSHARVAIDGALPVGALACLEDVAARFALQLVEIGPAAARRPRDLAPAMAPAMPLAVAPVLPPIPRIPAARAVMPLAGDDAPLPELAEGTGPIGEDAGAGAVEQGSSTALVSAATALVNAAMAITGESSGAALAAKLPGDAACKAAPPSIAPSGPPSTPGDAACKAAPPPIASSGPPSTASDAACKAVPPPSASSEPRSTATNAAAETATETACKAAPAARAGDPGLLAALAAVLVAAGADAAAAAAAAAEAPSGPRLVIGPVRSGRIVDHVGHLIVIGDVNPGAEVRAEGSIIVLGRLRGVAHAAIGRDAGCIIALSLQPQQLRIGRMVARADDADRPSGGAEIAYATGETIVVERFTGRLPSGLAASM